MSRNHFLLIFFGEHISVIVVILLLICRYLRKGFFKVDAEGQIYDCKLKDMIQSHKETLTVILNGIIICIMFYLVVGILIPFAKDLPYVYRGEYPYIEGVVIKDPNIDSLNKMELYNVTIKDAKTGEELRVSLYGKNGIWTGDEIKAEYLPNSEIGILLEKNGERVRGRKENREQEEDKENEIAVPERALIALISCALFGVLMKLAFNIRYGRTTVKNGTLEGVVVQVNKPYYKLLLISNIIFMPIGIFAFLATLSFVVVKDKENVRYTIFIFCCTVIAFVLWRYMKNKKIRITESGIWVKTLMRRKIFYSKSKITYVLIRDNKIKLLLGSSRRKITITKLYDNFEVLLTWLEMNCKEVSKI